MSAVTGCRTWVLIALLVLAALGAGVTANSATADSAGVTTSDANATPGYAAINEPYDELQPSEVMIAKGEYLTGAITLDDAIVVMRAYFFD